MPGDPFGLISCWCSLRSDAGPSVGRQRELRDLYAIENYACSQLNATFNDKQERRPEGVARKL